MKINQPMIFLDSGNPEETRKAKNLLGNLDGQTTNPSLVVKNPEVAKFLSNGKKLSEKELLDLYKKIIQELEQELPDGHLSIEVNANWDSTPENLLSQAEEMITWGKNTNIKFPTTNAGVHAANEFVKKGGRVNMTLVFDQTQAAAVYAATFPAQNDSFLSPFMGRWDDRGYQGVDIIKNISRMYKEFDEKSGKKSHVKILAASIRNLNHLYASLAYGADILTIPYTMIEKWVQEGRKSPEEFIMPPGELKPMEYEPLEFNEDYKVYDIKKVEGSLLDEGLKKFSADWNSLII